MLLEKLVKQHRVDLLVADRLGLPLAIAPNQIGAHLRHLLGDDAKGERLRGIKLLLVAKADWFELEERFAGFVRELDVVFIAPRRYVGPAKSP